MSITVHFKEFDPLTGRLTERYDYLFIEIMVRARRLLSSRSNDEIRIAAKFLSEIHRDKDYISPLGEELKQPSITTSIHGEKVELVIASNEVEALHQNVGRVSLLKHLDFPEFTWHELFAILALSYMEKVCGAVHVKESWKPMVKSKWFPEEDHPNPFPQPTDEMIDSLANDCLILSNQALTYAESLHNQNDLLRALRVEENRQAAKIRHNNKSGPLKTLVIESYHLNHRSRSNRDAAHRIFSSLKQDQLITYDEVSGNVTYQDKVCLQTDDPCKRFEIWIGKSKIKAKR